MRIFCAVLSCSVTFDSLQPTGLYSPPDSSVHGNSPEKNPEVGCRDLLQGIFSTQGLNLGLLHCRKILYHLSHQGSIQLVNDEARCASFWTISCLLCITWGWPQKTTLPRFPSLLFPVGTRQWEALMGDWQVGERRNQGISPSLFLLPVLPWWWLCLLLCFKLPQGSP